MVKSPTKVQRKELMKNYQRTPEQIQSDMDAWEKAIYKNEYQDVLTTEECLVKNTNK